jgi:hypothetical protein
VLRIVYILYVHRAMGEEDVRFRVLYCRICHSDLALAKSQWSMSTYQFVLGYVSYEFLCGLYISRQRFFFSFFNNVDCQLNYVSYFD